MSFSSMAAKPLFEAIKRPKKIADVGIELEIEGSGLPENVPHWQGKQEGSLQNGYEYITKPIKADIVQTYVKSLAKYLADSGAQIKNTYRCSTHIHVNYLPETIGDLLGSIVIFTMFEPVLLSLCGPQRDGNLFCMSSYDTGDLTNSFERMVETFEMLEVRGWNYERGKYASLNAGRLMDLGTLEARCFPLSLDGAEVSKWVSWLLAIRDTAKAQPDKSLREYWKMVRSSPLWYANKIFGQEVYSLPNASSLIDLGTENAYELTKTLKKAYKKKETIKEDSPKKGFKKKSFGDPADPFWSLIDDVAFPPGTITGSWPVQSPSEAQE